MLTAPIKLIQLKAVVVLNYRRRSVD